MSHTEARGARLRAAVKACAPALGAVAVFVLCFRWSPAWLLPFLLTAPLAWPFFALIRRGNERAALSQALVWALALVLCATSISMVWPLEAEQAIWRSRPYAEETLHWVRTGEGPEGSPRLFLPRQALELVAFSALALATGGMGALVLGAALLNYMSFYVACLWRLSGEIPAALALGWPPWALIRVVAYVALGTGLARPLLARLPPRAQIPCRISRGLVLAGLAGVLLDVILKATLAPLWRRLLIAALGGAP